MSDVIDVCPHCGRSGHLYPDGEDIACLLCGWRKYQDKRYDISDFLPASLKKRKKRWKRIERNYEICQLKQKGLNLVKIARMFGLSQATISLITKDIPSKVKQGRLPKTRRNKRICKLHREGMSVKELSARYHIKEGSIRWVIREDDSRVV